MEKLNLGPKNLKKFGITMAVAFAVITLIIFIRQRHSIIPYLSIAALFFISALTIPVVLKPVYIFWMKFAFVLSWINTRLILVIIFYLVFTPISLVLKLFRKDLLNRKIVINETTYWKKREESPDVKSLYQRQF